MATQGKSFPAMPTRQWWALRDRFRRTMPSQITSNYLASALNMTDISARNNILPALRTTGLIDDDGKPTDRAVKWRDDTHYAEVCEEIRNDAYPQELLHVAPPDDPDREVVQRWFANTLRVGDVAARKMSTFYLLLCDADPQKAGVASTRSSRQSNNTNREPKKTATPASYKKRVPSEEPRTDDKTPEPPGRRISPSLHLNIQIHISPDASGDQIDHIFASMARHLKNLA